MADDKSSKKGDKEPSREQEQSQYEDWSKDDLMKKAEEAGIKGHAKMSKEELVAAIRDH